MPEKFNIWFLLMVVGLVLAITGAFFWGEWFINAPQAVRLGLATGLVAFVIGLGVLGVLHNRKRK
jgi:cytochrome b subunit of formate dehydrogenase